MQRVREWYGAGPLVVRNAYATEDGGRLTIHVLGRVENSTVNGGGGRESNVVLRA